MCKYKMDPASIVEHTERTRVSLDRQTDRQTDRRADKVNPVYPTHNFVREGGGICLKLSENVCFVQTLQQIAEIGYRGISLTFVIQSHENTGRRGPVMCRRPVVEYEYFLKHTYAWMVTRGYQVVELDLV